MSAINTTPASRVAHPGMRRRVRVAVALCAAAACLIAVGFWFANSSAPALVAPPSSVKTPNPSRAPWYYLSVADAVVYYDPRWAGMLPRRLGAWPLPIAAALGAVAIAGLLCGAVRIGRRRAE